MISANTKIKVLIVDDSAVVRQVLTTELSKAADIEVVGTAVDPFAARDKILALKPDVLTLDLEMPRMDGLTFLAKLMKFHPLPVIVVSSLTTQGSEMAMRAMELGAIDVVCKPGESYTIGSVSVKLAEAIRAAAMSKVVARSAAPSSSGAGGSSGAAASLLTQTTHKILAIGASTGGTEAIRTVLQDMPATTPGTLIVQHMSEHFTASFAKRLNDLCPMEVHEATHNELVVPGVALLAPGNHHMVLNRSGARYYVEIKQGPPVFHQRPSVDVLFHSVARHAGANAVGAILTGMGADGAQGLLAMKNAGAHTLAQNEESCVVFGMPKEAIRVGGSQQVVHLNRMSRAIVESLAARATAGAR